MLGPPSPPTLGTDHRSAPVGVSEYSLPLEPTTATFPSGATAGAWRMYWPSTSKRHFTEAAPASAAKTAASSASTISRKRGRNRTPRELQAFRTGRNGTKVLRPGLPYALMSLLSIPPTQVSGSAVPVGIRVEPSSVSGVFTDSKALGRQPDHQALALELDRTA